MGSLIADILRLATGQTHFYLEFWLAVTLTLVIAGVFMVFVGQRLIQPVCLLVTNQPGRALRWMPISAAGIPAIIFLLLITIVGSPLSVVVLFVVPMIGAVGYIACALMLGDMVMRSWGREVPDWLAVIVGVLLVRLVRAVPFIGATLHSFYAWFVTAAACALVWDLAVSWYRRRMPDEEQFAGESLIEWDDVAVTPEHGRPSEDTQNRE